MPRDNGSLKEARSLLSKYVKPKNEDPFWAMIAVKIYVSSRGKKWGPYSLKQVDFLLAKGSFQLSDWAWAEHIAKWVSVSEMLGLLDRCDEQKECCPLAKQPDGVRLETKPCSSQIEKQPAQFNAGCIPWWRKSVFRNLLIVTVGGLILLLVVGWGRENVDYNTLERRDGIAFEPGSNKPFDGRAVSYFPSGRPMYEAKFEGGMEEGKVVSWYANGQRQSEANMRKGKFHGIVNYWYDDGQMMAYYTYKNGKVIHRKDWNPGGGVYKRK